MQRRREWAFTLMMVLLASLLLCSTATGAAPKAEVVFGSWYPGVEEDQDHLLEGFRKQNPDMKVEFMTIPWGGYTNYWERIATLAAGGLLPDLLAAPHALADVAMDSFFRSLDDLATRYPDMAALNDLMPPFRQGVIRNGKLMAFPYDSSVSWITYNKDVFHEAGLATPLQLVGQNDWTLEMMIELTRKITRLTADGNIIRQGLRAMNVLSEGYTSWLWANGGTLVENDEFYLHHPANIDVVTKMKEMLDEKRLGWGLGDAKDVGMLQWWSGIITHVLYHQKIPNGTLDQVPFPTRSGVQPANLLNVNVVGITRDCRDVDSAWKLLTYITREGVRTNMEAVHGDVPGRVSHIPAFVQIRTKWGIEGNRLFGTPIAEMRLNHRFPVTVNQAGEAEFAAIWNGQKSPLEGLREASRRMDVEYKR